MSRRQIVKDTLNGVVTEQVPYSFDMTKVVIEKLAGAYGVKQEEVHETIGDYMKYVYTGPAAGYEINMDDSHYVDEFGVVWNKGEETRNMGDWGGVVSTPLKEPSLEGYQFPDPFAPGRYDPVIQESAKAGDRFVTLHMDGLYDVAWHVRGFEQLMMDFACEEKFVNELLDRSLEYNLGMISAAPDCIDGIRFGEDWGQQKGLLMGGKIWRKFLKPRLKEMYAAAAARGFHVLIHSCGDIAELFPDLIEMGVQAVNPIQPEVMDVAFLKKEYGKDITLYGGLGCQSTIPNMEPEDVLKEAEERLELLSKGGRYIFGPAGAIPTETKLENVLALTEFARNGYKRKKYKNGGGTVIR